MAKHLVQLRMGSHLEDNLCSMMVANRVNINNNNAIGMPDGIPLGTWVGLPLVYSDGVKLAGHLDYHFWSIFQYFLVISIVVTGLGSWDMPINTILKISSCLDETIRLTFQNLNFRILWGLRRIILREEQHHEQLYGVFSSEFSVILIPAINIIPRR